MKVYDVILHIRSRLSDEESKKWHDNEIVDSINNAYIEMARILRLFLQEITFEVTKDKNTFGIKLSQLLNIVNYYTMKTNIEKQWQ